MVRDAVIFVAGFSAVFASFGALVAVASGAVDRSREIVSRLGGGLLVVFGVALALASAGVARLPALRPLGNLAVPAHGVARPLLFGVTFGAAWTPCAGPLLGAALVASAQVDTAAGGALTLLIYGFGVGLPFVAVALAISVAPARPIRLGRSSQRLQMASAMVMTALGLLVISGRVEWLTGRTAQLIDAVT
jgi:cytochrome c-type biogenesis protein